jgi:anti-sigma factor RsiW
MTCDEMLRVQAYLDREVDAADVPGLERHLTSCAECQALQQQILSVRQGLRQEATYHRADSVLRGRILKALDREDGNRRWTDRVTGWALGSRLFWAGTLAGGFAATAATIIAFLLVIPISSSTLPNDILNAHLRSLMADHVVDVVSSDHHTVKPWFSAHTDVSPPVADFAREGYRLIGGRADYIDDHRASVVVYRHGAHIINVFAWADQGQPLPHLSSRNGYHLVFWKSGNLDFCAISDTALDELLGLQRLLKAMAVPDSRE